MRRKNAHQRQPDSDRSEPLAQLDYLDFELIRQLQMDGRLSLIELGQRLSVSHGTVRNRLEKLLATQVIRIAAAPDPAKMGFTIQVLIGLQVDLARVSDVEDQLTQFNEVTLVANVTGRLDFIIGAAFAAPEDLRTFLTEKLAKVRGIRRSETFHILGLGKRIWQWEIPAIVTTTTPNGRRPRAKKKHTGRG